MAKKQTALWLALVQGVLLSLGVYLLLSILVSLLLIRAVLPETGGFPAVAVSCVAASFVGAFTCAQRASWRRLPSGLLCACGFVLVLAAVGALCWRQITWLGHGGVLLLCAIAGGILAGVMGNKRKKRRRAVRKA